ncbi:MAG: hypothetical protein AAF892_02125 [Cyanobacteria bacterium P01_D01_bin.71]
MLFDRILEDSLGFIRRKLWSDKAHSESIKKTFQPTQTISGEFGVIHLLEGRDTPRAVRTWMYTPKRQKLNAAQMVATSTPMDLHIYIDFLGPLPHNTTPSAMDERALQASQRQRGVSVPTHRLQILRASHFLNAEGFYSLELVHWQDVDCFPPVHSQLADKAADKIALLVADKLAFKSLEVAQPLKLSSETWSQIVDKALAEATAKVVARAGESQRY